LYPYGWIIELIVDFIRHSSLLVQRYSHTPVVPVARGIIEVVIIDRPGQTGTEIPDIIRRYPMIEARPAIDRLDGHGDTIVKHILPPPRFGKVIVYKSGSARFRRRRKPAIVVIRQQRHYTKLLLPQRNLLRAVDVRIVPEMRIGKGRCVRRGIGGVEIEGNQIVMIGGIVHDLVHDLYHLFIEKPVLKGGILADVRCLNPIRSPFDL
jgi:hypothetical protein